jgi:S-adenosylmethionine:tRNA ribosyltransferase-isomerase
MDIFKTSSYNFYFPKELIALHPNDNRDEARLMVINRKEKAIIHDYFYNIINYLNENDVLVINNTKVIPARIYAKKDSGGIIEILLCKKNNDYIWYALIKNQKKIKIGQILFINNDLSLKIINKEIDGTVLVEFVGNNTLDNIYKAGEIPIPPYINRNFENSDKENYQTVYSKTDGSVASPTAGLHFTEKLLKKIIDKGVEIVEVLLHVGLGTFQPVINDDIREHKIHKEYCEISKKNATILNNAIMNKKRIIAVGTTSVRTIESFFLDRQIQYGKKWTDLFIYPTKKFNIVDAMITNFHTPKSTLLMLVCAFAGYEFIMNVYKNAIQEKYRLFSYGDAMLII